jgi:hypothetical protein
MRSSLPRSREPAKSLLRVCGARLGHVGPLQRDGYARPVQDVTADQEGTAYNGHFGCTCYGHQAFILRLVELRRIDERNVSEAWSNRLRELPKLLDKILWWAGREERRGNKVSIFRS